ncbi:MAG: hypothetical protein AAGD13_23060 [Pseudomonadota bacterium]
MTFLLAFGAQSAVADDCYPEVDTQQRQFIVGYGSLMEEASKKRSSPNSGINHPAKVTGFQRVWNARGNEFGFSTTYLGVDAPKTAEQRRVAGLSQDEPEMYAAVYEDKDREDIAGTDTREKFYCRYPVSPDQIHLLDGWAFPSESQIWIYALKPKHEGQLPTEDWPIVQSYVDIFLTGCLDLADQVIPAVEKHLDFAAQCIETTDGWSEHWVNDRIYPRRAFIYQPNASTIDKLLMRAPKTKPLFPKIELE